MKNSWPLAAHAIARGESDTEAAKAAGVTARTIRTWKADRPEFMTKVNDIRRDSFDDVSGRLSALGVRAVEELERLLEAEGEATRLRAAQTILSEAKGYRDLSYIEGQITELRLAIEGKR